MNCPESLQLLKKRDSLVFQLFMMRFPPESFRLNHCYVFENGGFGEDDPPLSLLLRSCFQNRRSKFLSYNKNLIIHEHIFLIVTKDYVKKPLAIRSYCLIHNLMSAKFS